jgi:hypothetical protein
LYRISTPTVAIIPEEGKDVARMIPEGAIVYVDDPSALADDSLIRLYWDGTAVSMFAQDLRDRAERYRRSILASMAIEAVGTACSVGAVKWRRAEVASCEVSKVENIHPSFRAPA